MRADLVPVSAVAHQWKNICLRSIFLSLKSELSSNYPPGNKAGKSYPWQHNILAYTWAQWRLLKT